MRGAVLYQIAWWTGIAAGLAGMLAGYYEHWAVAIGLTLLAIVCAVIVWNPRK